MSSLGNHFNSPVDYSVQDHSESFFFMVTTGRCIRCGHMIVEETVPGGSMWTCLSGDVYSDGEHGCGSRFFVDED